MGFRFSRRIKIANGVHINLSKSGVGMSVGPRGLGVAVGPAGTQFHAGIPGTGLSYRQTTVPTIRGLGVSGDYKFTLLPRALNSLHFGVTNMFFLEVVFN